MRPFVRLNDPLEPGGYVKTASSSSSFVGLTVALVNDLVHCDLHGESTIVEGASGAIEHGREYVVDRCRTRCGCVVIATLTDSGVL
ncbi:PAAR domain-containing protein [Glaciimonas sp. PAMC28666]|uniref:PAAR domain-containing protein n=1 Tax=Glaciimonas sp. PAMC28666 TaxID=2807626 RepID=UPI001962A8D2|nr:PAAR domain-containing protein [Glaciimonas sp. PAMC28666]QRX83114.1 PAAR domain-containing protein [Glaciimonas sp. PAMC28666]